MCTLFFSLSFWSLLYWSMMSLYSLSFRFTCLLSPERLLNGSDDPDEPEDPESLLLLSGMSVPEWGEEWME